MISRVIVIGAILLTVALMPISEPMAGTNSAASLRLDLYKSNQQTVDVAVYAEGVSDLTAYRIDLLYDSELFSWNEPSTLASCEGKRNILSSRGGATPISLKTQRENRVIVANAIVKPDHRTAPSGEGLLGVISFIPSGELPVGSEVTFTLARIELKGIAKDDIDLIESLDPVQIVVRRTRSGFKDTQDIPTVYSLSQNYPNPFNPETTIAYDVPEDSRAKLVIYNINGQAVRKLMEGQADAGSYSLVWNGLDEEGRSVASGVYFYILKAGDFTATRKMVLLR